MLDPEIEKDLLITKQEVRQAYKDSLFFRLKNTAITRSSIDGNTRVVQLDEQYRMHPEIGSMISEVFYNGTVKNGIPRELTEHNIEEFMGKQFVWLDVPYSQGRETPGRSKSRLAEANVVSEITRLILGKNTCYSLGIITFYTEQRNLIINALKKDGVLEAEENLRLMPNYRGQLGNSRLKIGTVDAFQGQEFDIVILSLTRSNKDKLESLEDRIIRAKYGFLCSSNRQNVAFSRGKRLLITIGDLEMFSNDLLKNAMPGFYSLVSKCGGPNGSIVKL
jgi:superfamily I DNA and/or RNA helicase